MRAVIIFAAHSRAVKIITALLWAAPAHAAVQTETIEYRHDGVVLAGHLAYDDESDVSRPGILVVHEWKGLNDYARGRAEQLAGMGYVAFAVDMYGKGVLAKDHDEARELSGVFHQDRALMRARARTGLTVLTSEPRTDPERLAAIGYCFGGTTVLELARAGEALDAVVTFHGGLSTPTPEDAVNIRGMVRVFHGADDQFVTADVVSAFEDEMRAAGVDYQLISYPGAAHGFTVPAAGDDPTTGMAYDVDADRDSWERMRSFLEGLWE